MGRTLHMLPCLFFLVTFGSHTARLQTPPDLFDFQSAFWVNLHNYLHALARSDAPLVEPLPESATAGEGEQWNAYVMYMETQRMFDRGYRGMRPAITTHWAEFLEGKVSRAEATERILRDLQ